MHGIITSYDARKQTGWIQGDNGQIYDFKRQDLQKDEEAAYLRSEVHVDFEPATQPNADGKYQALELVITNLADCEEKVYYQEPEGLPTFASDLVEGYDILDRALYRIERRDRTEDKALYRLRYDCQQVKANAIVGYKVTTELKGAFGYGFNVYIASGVPVVLAKRHEDGDCTVQDLKHRIDQNQIKKLHSSIINHRIGKIVLKALGAVLIFVFMMGFIMTGGV